MICRLDEAMKFLSAGLMAMWRRDAMTFFSLIYFLAEIRGVEVFEWVYLYMYMYLCVWKLFCCLESLWSIRKRREKVPNFVRNVKTGVRASAIIHLNGFAWQSALKYFCMWLVKFTQTSFSLHIHSAINVEYPQQHSLTHTYIPPILPHITSSRL